MLVATGRELLISPPEALICMPHQGREMVTVGFFKPGGWASIEQLSMYAKHGLAPDPYAQGAVNRDDPAFADVYANISYWMSGDGKCYFMICDNSNGVRYVTVAKLEHYLYDVWCSGVSI